MATKNEQLVGETGAAILTAIQSAITDGYTTPDALRQLAEAYALVASNDPKVMATAVY
jgi:hypothetical protein